MRKFRLGNYNMQLVYLNHLFFTNDVMIVPKNADHLHYNLKVWYEELNENKKKMNI